MTLWAVRLRYRGPDPALAPSAEDRQALAAWVTDVLSRVEGGAYRPVHVAADQAGYDVTLRVEAADSYQAILRGSALVAEVVGDSDRVLGALHTMATVPPPWRLTAVLPRPC